MDSGVKGSAASVYFTWISRFMTLDVQGPSSYGLRCFFVIGLAACQ